MAAIACFLTAPALLGMLMCSRKATAHLTIVLRVKIKNVRSAQQMQLSVSSVTMPRGFWRKIAPAQQTSSSTHSFSGRLLLIRAHLAPVPSVLRVPRFLLKFVILAKDLTVRGHCVRVLSTISTTLLMFLTLQRTTVLAAATKSAFDATARRNTTAISVMAQTETLTAAVLSTSTTILQLAIPRHMIVFPVHRHVAAIVTLCHLRRAALAMAQIEF
jgi:hypothetical protein